MDLVTLALARMGGGGGGSITVDDEMSDTSTNPVQNKVITAALAAATTGLRIVDEDNDKTYAAAIKITGGKPVLEYEEI